MRRFDQTSAQRPQELLPVCFSSLSCLSLFSANNCAKPDFFRRFAPFAPSIGDAARFVGIGSGYVGGFGAEVGM